MKKPLEIPVDIYRCYVVVFFGSTVDEIVSWGKRGKITERHFTSEWRKAIGELMKDFCSGFAMDYGEGNRDILVYLRDVPRTATQYGVLYHELYHVVDHIAWASDEEHGWYTKDKTSEPRAFLFGYLATRCNRELWNKPHGMKNG